MLIGEYNQRDIVVQTILWQIIGLLLMICHILLVKQSPLFYPVIILIIGWFFVHSAIAGMLLLWQTLLFQNLLIAIFSSDMDYSTFNALQGTNFAVICVLMVISAARLVPMFGQYRRIAKTIMIALGFVLIYTVIGAAKSSPTSAIVYFREFASPIFAGIIGIEIGRVWGFRTIGMCLLYGSILALLANLIEYFYPIDFYAMINEVRFLQLKNTMNPTANTFYTPEDIATSYTGVFFNITGASAQDYPNSFRFAGTIINSISNAYVLSVLAILAIALKRSYWLLLIMPMLIMVGVKGANILLITSLVLYVIWSITQNRRLLIIAGLVISVSYVAFGLYVGSRNNDFHVIGFMGGFRSLLHVPVGHGIGVGGNMSLAAAKGLKWTGQGGMVNAGVDFALESAVGVLIYQMGVAAFSVLAVFIAFLWKAPLGDLGLMPLPQISARIKRGDKIWIARSDIIFFGLAMVMVNGIFQEEAYAPYAAGLLILLAGVLIGNQYRDSAVLVFATYNRTTFGLNRMIRLAACFALFVFGIAATCQAEVPVSRLQSMSRGANIATLFDHKADLNLDLQAIAAVGFKHVRVFVYQELLSNPKYLHQLDVLMSETAAQHLPIMLCLHSRHQWDEQKSEQDWVTGWTMLAQRYRASSPEQVFIEIANEPKSPRWEEIQEHLRKMIRAILPKHTLLLTGSPVSTVWVLPTPAPDDNVVYVFHLYQPMVLTHQGADWMPAFKAYQGLVYPPNAKNIRPLMTPETQKALAEYELDGARMMGNEIDHAIAWRTEHHVPIICNEFGVYDKASPTTRAAWLGEARRRLEAAHIGWSVWEWRGGFGVAPATSYSPLAVALGLP